jgi:hypothetical protein
MRRLRTPKRYPNPVVTKQPMVAERGSPAEPVTARTSKPVRRREPPTRTRRLSRAERYRKAAALLREWMADDTGYDEEVGALLEEELKKDPIRFREEF